jgi:hypothetical protein
MAVIEVDHPDMTLPADADRDSAVAQMLSELIRNYEVQDGRLVDRSAKSGK